MSDAERKRARLTGRPNEKAKKGQNVLPKVGQYDQGKQGKSGQYDKGKLGETGQYNNVKSGSNAKAKEHNDIRVIRDTNISSQHRFPKTEKKTDNIIGMRIIDDKSSPKTKSPDSKRSTSQKSGSSKNVSPMQKSPVSKNVSPSNKSPANKYVSPTQKSPINKSPANRSPNQKSPNQKPHVQPSPTQRFHVIKSPPQDPHHKALHLSFHRTPLLIDLLYKDPHRMNFFHQGGYHRYHHPTNQPTMIRIEEMR